MTDLDDRDEIHMALIDEPVVPVSSGFTGRVMRAVHEEAAVLAPAPLPFPWHRFLPPFLGATTACLAALMMLGWAAASGVELEFPVPSVATLDSDPVRGLALGLGIVIASLTLAWKVARSGTGQQARL